VRIPYHKAFEWRGEEVMVKPLLSSRERKAYHIHVPAEYVGFSSSFTYWIQYQDADTSCDVVDIHLVGNDEIRFIR